MAERQHFSRGFTLLEILVALVVLGLLMTGLSEGLRLGLKSWDRQNTAIQARAELDAIDRVLRNILTHLSPGTGRGALGIEGKVDKFQFQSELPSAVALITRRADMALELDDRKRLVLRWRPHLHETPIGDPPPETETVLLEGVQKLEISYWSLGEGNGQPPGWQNDWSAAYLPSLIKLRLSFPKGDGRHWPDIVIAPLLEQPGG
jgi:general secretion pathway protein J